MDEREWVAEAIDEIEQALADGTLVTLDVELDGERRIAIAALKPHPARIEIQLLGVLIDQELMKRIVVSEEARLRLRR